MIFSLIMQQQLFASTIGCNTSVFEKSTQTSNEIIQITQLIQLQNNPNLFCNEQLALRYLQSKARGDYEVKPDANEINRAIADGNIEQLTEKYVLLNFKKNGYNRRYDSLTPLQSSRLRMLEHVEFKDPDDPKVGDITLNRAIELLSTKHPCMEVRYIDCSKNYEKHKIPDIKTTGYQTRYACYEILGLRKINSCNESMATITRIATPFAGVTAREIHKAVMFDSRYNEGLRLAALRIAKLAKTGLLSNSNLFDDLKSSFRESGQKENDAEEMTWNTLAILSASGPNLDQRLMSIPYSYDQAQKRLAMHVQTS